jgi:hypothetical protein
LGQQFRAQAVSSCGMAREVAWAGSQDGSFEDDHVLIVYRWVCLLGRNMNTKEKFRFLGLGQFFAFTCTDAQTTKIYSALSYSAPELEIRCWQMVFLIRVIVFRAPPGY